MPRNKAQGTQTVEINGAHGEGGGALLRTALAFSALTLTPVRIHGVRGALRKPGLNNEDLTFLALLSASTRAEVTGDEPDSADLRFVPTRPPRSVNGAFDTRSHQKGSYGGNVNVIAQSALPVLARAGSYSAVTLQGETHGANTLSFEAFERSALAVHRAQGVCGFVGLAFAGFAPNATGELSLEVEPSAPSALVWPERGSLVGHRAVVCSNGIPADTLERGLRRIGTVLPGIEVEQVDVRAKAPGMSLTVWTEFEQGAGSTTGHGQRGWRIEVLVDAVLERHQAWLETKATVDEYLADQLLPVAALASGRSVYTTPRVTRRLTTVAWVIRQFLPVQITIKGQEGYSGTVTVGG